MVIPEFNGDYVILKIIKGGKVAVNINNIYVTQGYVRDDFCRVYNASTDLGWSIDCSMDILLDCMSSYVDSRMEK